MARKPSPWYRSERNEWWVRLNGVDQFLGDHPPDAPKPKKSDKTGKWNAPPEIEDAFFKLRGGGAKPPGDSVVQILDDFVTWSKQNRSRLTAEGYEKFCQNFVRSSADGVQFGTLPAGKLSSKHVTAWLNQRATWGPTTRKNAITAIMAGFNWAVANRGLDRNPIQGMRKPEATRRSDVITPPEFEELLSLISDQEFRDLLIVSYDCGARPFEVKELEKRHLQLDKHRALIPAEEAKGRKHTRTIYFPTDRSMEIISRLAAEHSGHLFHNKKGNRWTGNAVKCRFEDLEIAFGIKEMERQGMELDVSEESIAEVIQTLSPTKKSDGKTVKKLPWELRKEARLKLVAGQAKQYGKRFNHYAFRRTFITGKIIAGVDSHIVAKLSGHQSTAMIDRHYSAVANDHAFMLEQASRTATPEKDS